MLRVGIVGYGFAGRGFHAYLLNHEPRLKLTAVASRSEERRRLAETDYGVRTYPSLERMLEAGGLELVIVATPHDLHASQAIAVMDAGLPCVCDKVMCLTGTEADAMIAARDRNRVLLSVFHNRRWDGDYLTIRRLLEADLIGTPRLYETGIWRFGAPRGWRGQKSVLGTIMHDWGAHFLDQMFQLVPGKVASVSASAQRDWPVLDIESYMGAQVRFENGTLFRIELSNRARLGKPRWFIQGEAGTLIKEGVDPQEAAMLRGDIRSAREDPESYARVATEIAGAGVDMRVRTLPGDWTAYYRNVADALLEGAAPAVLPEEARRGVLLLEAIQCAERTGPAVVFREGL